LVAYSLGSSFTVDELAAFTLEEDYLFSSTTTAADKLLLV